MATVGTTASAVTANGSTGPYEPTGVEKQLLDLIGQLGKDELTKLQEGKLFELDANTRTQLDRILQSQTGAAKSALGYGLDKAAGTAAASSASRVSLAAPSVLS